MKLDPGTFCPLLKKTCIKTECAWFIQVMGTNKNTGEPVNEWGCSVAWLPHLIIEGNGEQRQTGAAVESFRNEMVKSNQGNRQLELTFAQPYQQEKLGNGR